jgi:hypothetical protein
MQVRVPRRDVAPMPGRAHPARRYATGFGCLCLTCRDSGLAHVTPDAAHRRSADPEAAPNCHSNPSASTTPPSFDDLAAVTTENDHRVALDTAAGRRHRQTLAGVRAVHRPARHYPVAFGDDAIDLVSDAGEGGVNRRSWTCSRSSWIDGGAT